jgi:hypothetical protein
VSTLSFSTTGKTKTPTAMTVSVLSGSTVVGSAAGPSVVQLLASLPAGTYTWQVSGTSSLSFTLQVTYAVP